MADPIKFSDDEMQKLAGIQTSYREKMDNKGVGMI